MYLRLRPIKELLSFLMRLGLLKEVSESSRDYESESNGSRVLDGHSCPHTINREYKTLNPFTNNIGIKNKSTNIKMCTWYVHHESTHLVRVSAKDSKVVK